ncbi:metallophosphoesterase [Halomicrobium sp. IBSBa]|uniref:Phosphoesterase n=1 Tax=Halomicrobium mukohataei TaxID=57705 RepID=A0A847U9E0_9EURY|nr:MULTISPECIES: metallophosphoesterase [Halomicrobium]MBO4247664.1 metallophosphoesterase [Halomicrobium sp. IBSBa]NLV09146.1 YfcE family phosphodiesterase [Halomicrobium mukohataei]
MLAIISDTHGTDDHRLGGRTLTAVREADTVIHAGDFTTEAVYDAITAQATELVAVAGNNEEPALRDRLPSTATVEWHGLRFVVVHGHEHSATALSLLARQEAADVVVVGHSHRPELSDTSEWLLVNPGSYADPRRYRPAHAELVDTGGALRATLYEPDGTVITEVCQ